MNFIPILLAVVASAGTITWVIRVVTFPLARKARNSSAVTWSGYVGAAVATVPALFAAFTLGGTVGGAWFEALIGPSAIPIGIGIGIFLTLVGTATFVGTLAAVIAAVLVGSVPQLNGSQ
ncbi:MAG: hypothetical protein OEV58_09730 [Gammaproteobacteria bacterium]|nr:hypothetical protein [Gammaproteobacteria bacterium]